MLFNGDSGKWRSPEPEVTSLVPHLHRCLLTCTHQVGHPMGVLTHKVKLPGSHFTSRRWSTSVRELAPVLSPLSSQLPPVCHHSDLQGWVGYIFLYIGINQNLVNAFLKGYVGGGSRGIKGMGWIHVGRAYRGWVFPNGPSGVRNKLSGHTREIIYIHW